MSENENLDVAKEFTHAWNAHDLDKVNSLYSENAILEDYALGLKAIGKKKLRKAALNIFNIFPDVIMEIRNLFSCGDQVILEGYLNGTNTGPITFPVTEKPPTGLHIHFPFVRIYQIKKRLISEVRDYWDLMTLFRCLKLKV